MEVCGHGVVYRGICATCGKDVGTRVHGGGEHAHVTTVHAPRELQLSRTSAYQAETESRDELLADRKLLLILDLDETLIHCTLKPTDTEQKSTDSTFHIREYVVDIASRKRKAVKTVHYVKKRPHLKEFLQNMKLIFEIYVFTMGTTEYAGKILEIVDPDKEIFKHRPLTRDDATADGKKLIERILPTANDSMVLIVDDNINVWSNYSENVVLIKPFRFYRGINMPGRQIVSGDTTLLKIGELLTEIHNSFFHNIGRLSVRHFLRNIRYSVFGGCTFYFLGPFDNKNREYDDAKRLASIFGANFSSVYNDVVTHVLISLEYKNWNWMLKGKADKNLRQLMYVLKDAIINSTCFIVPFTWLYVSSFRYNKEREEDFWIFRDFENLNAVKAASLQCETDSEGENYADTSSSESDDSAIDQRIESEDDLDVDMEGLYHS